MEENVKAANAFSAPVLAYIGDSFFELLTRERIVNGGNCNISDLSAQSKKFVTAVSQSAAAERVLPFLSAEEEAVYIKGRNAKTNHTPRSARTAEYHRATGLETLFGWLYICGRTDRARQVFDLCFPKETEEKT